MKIKKNTFVIVLTILLFPSLLYIVFTTGKHNIEKLSFIGPQDNGAIYTVPSAQFNNWNGESVDTKDLSNQIVLYNFFCTTCSDSSDRNTLLVKAITERFFDKKDITYLSINLTPSQWDSAEVSEYIRPFNIDPKQWLFVNSDSSVLSDFALNSLLIGTEYDPIGKQYQPGMSTIVIVDKQQHIRAFFDGSQYVDQSDIIDVIKRIRLEEYQQNAKRREDQFERKR